MSETNQPSFVIQKIYTKDLSFESINTPDSFKSKWDPNIEFNINLDSQKLKDDNYDVSLTLTINAKNNKKNVYIAEVTQSGIFTITNMGNEQVESILNTYCANTLFPYAKKMIDTAILKGGFTSLNLNPINFDAIYMQKKAEAAQSQKH